VAKDSRLVDEREIDARGIALVASRFREMQGLLTFPAAVWPIYIGVVFVLAGRVEASKADVPDWVFFVAAGVSPVACAIAYARWLRPRIVAYYESRFGRVKARHLFFGTTWIQQGVLAVALLADAHRPWLIAAACLLMIGAWPAWIIVRDWPYRWHWLPLLVVALLMARAMSGMPSSGAALRHMGPWCIVLGLGMACGSAGDHLTLVRALGRGRGAARLSEEDPG